MAVRLFLLFFGSSLLSSARLLNLSYFLNHVASLFYIDRYGDRDLQSLSFRLAEVQRSIRVEELILSRNRLTEVGVMSIIPVVRQRLQSLDLQHNRLGEQTPGQMYDYMRRLCTQLTSVSGCPAPTMSSF